MKDGRVFIGTSGWSYKDWKGIVYPEKLNQKDFLKFYAEYFNVTEINSSFYHLPKEKTIVNWMDKVPPEFKFCPKLSQFITHYQRLQNCEDSLRMFFEIFSPMEKMMGPVLIQLPASVKFDVNIVRKFYSLLRKNYSRYEFAIEGRNESWFSEESITLMKEFKISFVISQAGERIPYFEAITANNIYFRFHGPAELYSSSYSELSLKTYSKKFSVWLKDGYDVWVFFNNTMGAKGFINAQKLKYMLSK
jgi:uncharacterized protein YecE (DUF72 family)